MNPAGPDDIHDLAAEYVLGVLSAEEAAALERRMARDGALRAAVAEWEERLSGLTRSVAPVAPRPDLWARIETEVAAVPAGTAKARWRERLWGSLSLWRTMAAAGVVASLLLATVVALRPDSRPAYTVVLAAQDRTPGWIVDISAGGDLRLTPLIDTAVRSNQALQFWTLRDPAQGPISLGLVPPDRTTLIPAARLPAIGPNQLFELTLEPATGSPIGRPTGPVLYIGRTVAVR